MGVKVGLHDDCDDLTLRGHHVVQGTATYPDVDTLLADDVQPTTETTVMTTPHRPPSRRRQPWR